MAKLGVVSSVTVFFKEVPVKFKIEAVVEGNLDKEKKTVLGINAIEFKKELDKITRSMEYQGIGSSLKQENVNFYGMESIAIYIIKKLNPKFPVKKVTVWEGQDEFATVFADEI